MRFISGFFFFFCGNLRHPVPAWPPRYRQMFTRARSKRSTDLLRWSAKRVTEKKPEEKKKKIPKRRFAGFFAQTAVDGDITGRILKSGPGLAGGFFGKRLRDRQKECRKKIKNKCHVDPGLAVLPGNPR